MIFSQGGQKQFSAKNYTTHPGTAILEPVPMKMSCDLGLRRFGDCTAAPAVPRAVPDTADAGDLVGVGAEKALRPCAWFACKSTTESGHSETIYHGAEISDHWNHYVRQTASTRKKKAFMVNLVLKLV